MQGATSPCPVWEEPTDFMHDDHQRFEDGTVNYLDIPAISEGLRFVEEVGMGRLKQRVDSLALYLHQGLKGLRHANGTPLIRTYGPADRRSCGGTLGHELPKSGRRDHSNFSSGRSSQRKGHLLEDGLLL